MKAERRHGWGRWLGVVFGLAVLALLSWAASKVDWPAVLASLRQVPPATLALAALLCVCSHLIYSGYDLIGKHWTHHAVPTRRVMLITFISYAFNLNLGSLVGAFAIRLRLYAHEGLRQPVPAKVLALSLTTNWLGYGLLAGGLFLLGCLSPPPEWALSAAALKVVGGVMWLLVAGYLALCAFARRREYTVRGHLFVLPTIRIAALQLLISSANWLTIGLIIHVLLGQVLPGASAADIPASAMPAPNLSAADLPAFGTTLAVLLVAAVAGVLTHVPAGLGVLEGVFVALLGTALGDARVLAALIVYRALYYLAPLLVAATAYFVLEARSRR